MILWSVKPARTILLLPMLAYVFGLRLHAEPGARVTPRRLLIWPLRDP